MALFNTLYAIKKTVERGTRKVCPDFILQSYKNFRISSLIRELQRGGGIRMIELETVNRCNGSCPFCPVNVNQPQREYAKMPEELFRKIINDLANINYSETIGLYSNNEPLLDERIIDFYKYAKKKLPNAKFSMYTNGTLLTFEKFLELLPLLDFFVIDNYNDNYEFNTSELKKIYEYLTEHPEINEHDLRVNFAFRKQNEVLTTRGGQAPNKIGKNERMAIKLRCPLPFLQFVIRPTGEVSLCCSDTLGQCTMGDLKTQTISEVWNSEKYQAVRKELLMNGRKKPTCMQKL